MAPTIQQAGVEHCDIHAGAVIGHLAIRESKISYINRIQVPCAEAVCEVINIDGINRSAVTFGIRRDCFNKVECIEHWNITLAHPHVDCINPGEHIHDHAVVFKLVYDCVCDLGIQQNVHAKMPVRCGNSSASREQNGDKNDGI